MTAVEKGKEILVKIMDRVKHDRGAMLSGGLEEDPDASDTEKPIQADDAG